MMHQATEIVFQNKDWMTYVFLVIFAALAIARLVFDQRLYQNTTLFLSRKYLAIYFSREKRNTLTLFQSILVVPQLLVLAMTFFLLGNTLYPEKVFFELQTFANILAAVCLYFGLRFLLGLVLSSVLNLRKIHNKIMYEKTSYFNNIILWILPFLVLSSYAPINQNFNLKLTGVVFLILVFMRYALLMINNKKLILSNLFYFILYLCSLEIVPLLIITKTTI